MPKPAPHALKIVTKIRVSPKALIKVKFFAFNPRLSGKAPAATVTETWAPVNGISQITT